MHPTSSRERERRPRRSAYRLRWLSVTLLSLTVAATLLSPPTIAGATRIVTDIGVGFGAGTVALSSDGGTAYVISTNIVVTDQEVDGTLAVIDTATNTVTARIPVARSPRSLTISSDNTRVYIGSSYTVRNPDSSWSTTSTVTVIDTTTNTVTDTFDGAFVALSPDGRHLYLGTGYSPTTAETTISVIDTSTNAVVDTFAMTGSIMALVAKADGLYAYVAKPATDEDTHSSLEMRNLDTQTAVAAITLDTNIERVVLSPDGRLMYVTHGSAGGQIAVVDTATHTVVATIPTSAYHPQIWFSPDSRHAYFSHGYTPNAGAPAVSIVDTNTHTVVSGLFTKDGSPSGLAITPHNTRAYLTFPTSYVHSGGETWGGKVSVLALDAPPALGGTPPNGTVNRPYHHAFTVTGEPTPSVSVTSGALPDGVTLSSDGVLSGTPTTSDRFEFTVTATNSIGANSDLPVTVTIADTSSPLGSLGSSGS